MVIFAVYSLLQPAFGGERRGGGPRTANTGCTKGREQACAGGIRESTKEKPEHMPLRSFGKPAACLSHRRPLRSFFKVLAFYIADKPPVLKTAAKSRADLGPAAPNRQIKTLP